MQNNQLSNYIKHQLQQGRPKQEIEKELLGVGWKSEDIDRVFGVSNASPAPSFVSHGKQKLHPKAKWIFFFVPFSFTAIFIIGTLALSVLGFLAESGVWLWALIAFLLLTIFSVFISIFWAELSYKNYFFEIKEGEFSKESGVIYKHYVSIPYNRIQNVNIHRGILDRILGLSRLTIQTAGRSRLGAEGNVPGIPQEQVEKIRDDLILYVSTSKNQGI